MQIGLLQQELLKIKQKLYPETNHSRPPQYVTGKIRMLESGDALCIIEETEESVFIHRNQLSGAMQDDIVAIELRHNNGRKKGEVIEILKRERSFLVGQLSLENGYALVTPIYREIPNQIKVKNHQAKDKDYVLVKLSDAGDGYPYGSIEEILGAPQTPFIDEKLIIYKYQLPHRFKNRALEEAERIPSSISDEEIRNRVDLRRERIFTIDGEDAKDFDDAVSIKRLANGHYLLGVHIADVSHYVKEGSALDAEAYERGTSVYFANQMVIPMFPPRLSEDILSLIPHKNRLAISCIFEFDEKGKPVGSVDIFPSVIRSRAHLSYNQVNDILEGRTPKTVINPHIPNDLELMAKLASILRENRLGNGSLNLNLPEPGFVFNENGEVTDIKEAGRGVAH
ncbi:TPA: RNB domain-containing ribonuclease, partial [Candidatus Poribacteria bacterium]|nr:RNB domain-containing ribonuclease [Candidatus Poribacteria bacterium]